MNKNTVYILQKDLPEAKAGTELRFDGDRDYDYVATNGEECWYKKHYVENNPEWFKPKEEPQWEILSLKYKKNGEIYPFTSTPDENFEIHSVKRLSDGEVFSVGDSLDWMCKIESIEIDDRFNGGIVFINNSQKSCISTAKKAPKEEQVPHRCKYCNALVTSDSDEGCYANPNRINEDIGSEEKQEEQVPIKVESIAFYTSFGEKQIRDTFAVNLSDNISEDKLQQIKSAIERELNNYKDERPVPYASYKHLFDQHQELLSEFSKMHTSEELLQARRDTFDAAREVVGYSDAFKNSPVTVERKYKDNEDYINSLK